MKYIFTGSDTIKAMVREDMTITAKDRDEAWEKAKARFARKYKTSKLRISITAVQQFD